MTKEQFQKGCKENIILYRGIIKKEFIEAINNVGAIIESPDMYMYLSGYDNLKLIANLYNVKPIKPMLRWLVEHYRPV